MSDPIFKLPDQVAHVAQIETVLDVATGRAAVLLPAAWQVGPVVHVIGIDIAQGMVDETAAAVRVARLTNVRVCRMDAEQLEFPDATFDAVLCGLALFFFPNLRATLAQCLRVLKPGGRLAVSTWGRDDERWSWLGDLRQKYSPAQFRQAAGAGPAFNQPNVMLALLRESGFNNVQVIEEDFEFTYADEEEWQAVQWSHGMRFLLETAEPAARDQIRAEAFAHLKAQKGSDGIPHRLGVLFTTGVKP